MLGGPGGVFGWSWWGLGGSWGGLEGVGGGGEGAADCAERLNPPPPEGSERV